MYPYLRRGLPKTERDRLLDSEARRLGYRFSTWPRGWFWSLLSGGGKRSMCTPWGVLYLSDPARLHVKAHELRHAQQVGQGLWPWFWGLMYILLPWVRRWMETDAEAMEAAFYCRWVGAPDSAVGDYIHAPSLGSWGPPYFMGGRRVEMLVDCQERALEILREADGVRVDVRA